MSEFTLPSPFLQILTVMRYEFLKSLKVRKLYGMIAFAYVVPILLISLPEFLGSEYLDSPNEFISSQMNFLTIIIVISVSFFGSSAIVSEFHNRTAYSLFPNPISRNSIWFGKFFTAVIISFVISSIFYKVLAIGAWSIYGSVPVEIISSWTLSFPIVVMVTSISFLFSAILKSQTTAIVSVFILFVLIFPMIEGITVAFAEDKPWWLPSFISKVTEFSMYSPYPSDLIPGDLPRGPFDQHRYVAYVDESLSLMLAYSLLTGISSIVIFKKKEMS